MLDDRLYIDLQRVWFDRRGDGCVGEQVARSMNDCENARKILDLFQKEPWIVAIGVPAVIYWQLSLAPELLTALLVASILPFLAALFFGGLIQKYSLNILKLVAGVSSAVARGNKKDFYEQQESFYINRIWFELFKQMSEATAEFAYWISLVLILVLTTSGVWPLFPMRLQPLKSVCFLLILN